MSEYCENYDRTHQDIRTENGIDYGDMLSGVDIPYLTRNIRINLATAMNLAQAPARPEKARIANAGDLANYTVLAWEPVRLANGQADLSVSYEILFRETDQPEWQVMDCVSFDPAQFAPTFQCPLSKDNYFFAVRACSAAGHPSLPAVAR